MHIPPVVLAPKGSQDILLSALHSCEKQNKIPKGFLCEKNIQSLPFTPQKNQDVTFVAKQILNKLKTAERILFVDAVTFAPALALLNSYKEKWGITDDVVEKLHNIVYDEDDPDRATVVRDITEALQLIERYHETKQVVYITASGHAYNFAEKLTAQKSTLPGKLPEFKNIIEVNPDKAFEEIRTWLVSGKIVVADRLLLEQSTLLCFALNSLAPSQRFRLHSLKEENIVN